VSAPRIVALSGGIGGAKLSLGLYRVLPPGTLTVIVNTGVTFGYAALPALLIAHVTPAETGIANSVNSISRSVGMSLGTAFVVTMMTRNAIPGPVPLPREAQFVSVFVVGAVLAAIAAAVVAGALPRVRRVPLTPAEVEADEVLGAAGLEYVPVSR